MLLDPARIIPARRTRSAVSVAVARAMASQPPPPIGERAVPGGSSSGLTQQRQHLGQRLRVTPVSGRKNRYDLQEIGGNYSVTPLPPRQRLEVFNLLFCQSLTTFVMNDAAISFVNSIVIAITDICHPLTNNWLSLGGGMALERTKSSRRLHLLFHSKTFRSHAQPGRVSNMQIVFRQNTIAKFEPSRSIVLTIIEDLSYHSPISKAEHHAF